ncbi:MAG TPA: four helix bundle protein [Bacteroidales bacterium]|jgi:four helix bundle protein|nr:four helix bundle protein [Bacteroidales bacterium]HNR40736.1 four helix bundle protein [Bacteroidales bacterium]
MTTKELEERLIQFAAMIIELTDSIKKTRAGLTLIDQMSRSSISAALNYGESAGAESPRDFIHKLQVVLKELRETLMALRITQVSKLTNNTELLKDCLQECNELVSIFTKSVISNKKKINDL